MNVAGWILMVFMSNGVHGSLKLTAGYQHKAECLDAASDFVIPPDFKCPDNAVCAEPIGVGDVVVARVCVQGFAGSN